MQIQSIEIVNVALPKLDHATVARKPGWWAEAEVANPMSRYAKVKRHRSMWLPQWDGAWVKITAEDGTWGLATLSMVQATRSVVEQLAQHLVGEPAMAIERCADMMFRLTKPYGTTGLASYAISAIDLALWDLKGKLLGQPVYALLGGPQKDSITCYATGNDVDWYVELGFKAFKLACPYGPADGLDGIMRNADFVAKAREIIGEDAELMLDCWMAFDVEYTCQLAEALQPYHLRWMEECLIPEDFDAHLALRNRLPWQTLATGEHWYTHVPFQWAVRHHAVDIVQPDINWCGGMSTCNKIAAMVDAGGMNMILHGGGLTAYGQHFTFATPSAPMCEYFVGSPPGVPLEEAARIPGVAVAKNGTLIPNDAPGFGMDIAESWITPCP